MPLWKDEPISWCNYDELFSRPWKKPASLLVVAALQEFYEQGDKSTKNP